MEFKGWNICRIDGKTAPLDRRAEMDRFNNGGDDPEAPILFLLSTRSGGLGINLVAADTVIFYDQDWVCDTLRLPLVSLTTNDRTRKWISKHKTGPTELDKLGPSLCFGWFHSTQLRRVCSNVHQKSVNSRLLSSPKVCYSVGSLDDG